MPPTRRKASSRATIKQEETTPQRPKRKLSLETIQSGTANGSHIDNNDNDRKRRRDNSRVKDIPNYKTTRTKKSPSTATSQRKSIKSDTLIDPNVIVLEDLNDLPACFKKSLHNEQIQFVKADPEGDKESQTKQLKSDLADIVTAQESNIEELYHLQHFTSLLYFKPGEPKQPDNFATFRLSHQLWPQIDQETLGRRSRRVTEHNDPLKLEIEKLNEHKKKLKLQETKIREQQTKQQIQDLDDGDEDMKSNFLNGNETKEEDVKGEEEKAQVTTKTAKNKKTQNKATTPIKKTPPSSNRGRKPKVKEEEEEYNNSETMKSEDESELEHDSDSDVSIPPMSPSTKIPKSIRFKFNVKPQVITHPSHVTAPQYKDLDEFFNSYRGTIEEPGRDLPVEEYQEYLESQNQLVHRIKKGIDSKLLRLDLEENIFRNVPAGAREPTMIKKNSQYNQNYYRPPAEPYRIRNDLTHYDHLLAQGVKSARLIHDLRNTKLQKCKKIAQMIETHFKRLSQEKERSEREFEKKIIKLAKDTAKEVKKKWLIAAKAYRILEEREREKERALRSKEQLSKILDHSTKVLGAQLVRKSVTPGMDDSRDIEGMDSQSDGGDENMSSSSDEGDDDEEEEIQDEAEIQDDSKLTVEELKEKYKNLDSIPDIPDSDDESDEEEPNTLAGLYGSTSVTNGDAPKQLSIVDQLTEEERTKLLEENSTDAILDEDESSYDSADDSMSDSDDELMDESEFGSENAGEVEEDLKPGLASLFGKPVDNSDEESIYSEKNNDTPSSSPKDEDDTTAAIPDVPYPELLRGQLRIYQKQGLNWMASLYNNGTNGILADEMGLGKTIQTISLISYLACEKNIWGPHLIVVPTSVMLNWEMEFKRFAPGFKVMTYYGSPQQRKEKRKGWNTPDTFHICITSYQLVVQDQQVFKRKKWRYMILDEAHNIKNFRSQRWNALLNFNTENRLLLTGTPLQNNIMELWSLLYFLMPSTKTNQTMPEGFANLMDFQQWFGRPVDKIIQGGGYANIQEDSETKETVNKLHQVLRPYLLRRLKQDVEKQMPAKHEHIVYCRLSKRQRLLYDDFMSRAQTKETLASGNFLSIINCLMQLRKVCNHPDLFEVRPILTSFSMQKSVASNFGINDLIVKKNLNQSTSEKVNLQFLNLTPVNNSGLNSFNLQTLKKISASNMFAQQSDELEKNLTMVESNFSNLERYYEYLSYKEQADLVQLLKQRLYTNNFNCDKQQLVSSNLLNLLTVKRYSKESLDQLNDLKLVKSVETRSISMYDSIEKYSFVTPKAIAQDLIDLSLPSDLQTELRNNKGIANPFHHSQNKLSITFPDKSLLQFDCGKLQRLASLLQDIVPKGHRVLIFTQMTKVLDILEKFMNYNGYKYMRLDGATKIEDRQLLTERFNKDNKIKCFILSTRSGGLGINLTGADTVIFYDSDWNPAMDKQCQDRCHRIGQTRDVHIYRFVSEYTIESNILKKANQKRELDNVIIQEGDFTTDYFSKITVQDMLGQEGDDDGQDSSSANNNRLLIAPSGKGDFSRVLEQAEDAEDANAAKMAMKEANMDEEDFDDEAAAPTGGNTPTNGTSSVNNAAGSAGSVEPDDMIRRIVSKESKIADVTKEVIKASGSTTTNGNNDEGKENEESEDEYDEEDEEDDGIGHIDEYMIRFISGGFYYD